MPLAIEQVKGMRAMVRKAGMALERSSQSISDTWDIMSTPTKMLTAAVAVAGMDENRGAKKRERKK